MSEGYRYDRVLLKLSGEALAGDVGYGIDPKVATSSAAWPVRPRAWIARRPTTSACWPR